MNLKNIKNLDLRNKKVLLRVNFDLPIKNGKILDDSRIKAHLPTIFYLIKKKAKVILISHLNNPQKIKNKELRIKKCGLKPVFENLKSQISNLKFVNDCLGKKVEEEIDKLKGGEVILLENLRFYPEEEKNDKNFAKKLANLADIYINDAFPVCHRKNASLSAITNYLPSYAGFLLEKEIKNLSQVLKKPDSPFIILLGGAKISTKLPMIKNFIKKADKILIGGALANTFFKAKNLNISQSIYESKMIKEAKELLKNEKIILPIDVKIKLKTKIQNLKLNQLAQFKNFKILDIGQMTIRMFANYLKSAKMIVWNGPMGFFEKKPFEIGTKEIIKEILKNKKAKIFIGGGETIASLQFLNYKNKIPKNVFISTGGGAMLDFLSGKILPGIKPLLK
ncbi:MAG: phosphoglycerate kinase [Patescibacteria group bacterium]